jgi:hypothetical protein
VSERDLAELLEGGVIQPVARDTSTAREELAAARLHIETAESAARRDPTGAFALGYDAIRKAISGHMRANGFRAAKGPGQHARTGRYALAVLDTPGVTEHLDAFDELRLLRNQSQYEGLGVEPGDVADLLVHAHAIIGAIEEDLRL